MKSSFLKEPEFETDGFFQAIFYRSPEFAKATAQKTNQGIRKKTREKTREKILASIRDNPRITTSELSQTIGLTSGGIEWNIKKLKAEGSLEKNRTRQGRTVEGDGKSQSMIDAQQKISDGRARKGGVVRLSKDKTSWKARGIMRRDLRHTKSGPEIEKPRSSKNTKKWCGGKVGVPHVKKWVKSTKYVSEWWEHKCGKCGKVFDVWINSRWFQKPKPKEIE